MAIIRSLAMGKARKSAGNLTFRTVRGRTIASEKRGKNPASTRGDGVTIYQFNLGVISMFMRDKRSDIDLSFDKTTYGSQSNGFMKVNYKHIAAALKPLFDFGTVIADVTASMVVQEMAVYVEANPNTIIRVKKAGLPIVYLQGEWKSEDDPTPPTKEAGFTIDGNFHAYRFTKGATTAVGVLDVTPTNKLFRLHAVGIGDMPTADADIKGYDKADKEFFRSLPTRIDANTIELGDETTVGDTDKLSYVIISSASAPEYSGSYVIMQ